MTFGEQRLKLALFILPRYGYRILAIGTGLQRRGGVGSQLIQIRREFMIAVEDLVVGDDLTRVSGHPAHRRDQAGLGAALGLVEGLIISNRIDEMIPLELIGVRLGLWEFP